MSRGWSNRSRSLAGAPFRLSAVGPTCLCQTLSVTSISQLAPAEKPKKVYPKKIAIVVHQEQSRPGRVGALPEKRGYELHRLCPNLGCNLPRDMSDYAG